MIHDRGRFPIGRPEAASSGARGLLKLGHSRRAQSVEKSRAHGALCAGDKAEVSTREWRKHDLWLGHELFDVGTGY